MPMETKELFESLGTEDEEELLRLLKRKQRIDEMRLQKQRTMRIHRCILGAAAVVLILVGFGIGAWLHSAIADASEKANEDNIEITSSGQEENAGQAEDPSRAEAPGHAEDFDHAEAPGHAENSGQAEAPGQAEDPSQAGNSGQAEEPGRGQGDGLRENVAQEDLSVLGIASALTEGGFMSGMVSDAAGGNDADDAQEITSPEEQYYHPFTAYSTETTADFSEEIISKYGILVDVEEGAVMASRNPHDQMNPASMTKILTVLTAAEILGIEDESSPVLEDHFTITIEITDYSYVNECSIVGFDVDEIVSIRDLFYGTILPSGADAAVGLAVYVSGSQEEFVNRMNEKLEELKLSDTTHFTNCVGLYDENHYSTVYDIAVILKEASDNTFCRQVLSAHTYTTSLTEQHPEGIRVSNWFLRRIEDKDTYGEVLCGKTGYVKQSGSCAASLATDGSGREYLCVTAGSSGSWQCINDQTNLFQGFLPVPSREQ